MNVALCELPSFTCLPGKGAHHTAGIILAPTLRYMEQAYFDARTFGWSKKPIVELLIPSTLDDSLAPPGQHVAIFSASTLHRNCRTANRGCPQANRCRSHDRHRQRVRAKLQASVLGRQIMSPLDLERTFGLIGGDIMHGTLQLDQMFSARPMLGHGNYRGPLPGLYMCGAGTHPGGGVTGAPGHNAAREILADFKRGRLNTAA